ncbi:MAG: amidohydrolase family protein [Candidatus Hodarchaeota archaeon]
MSLSSKLRELDINSRNVVNSHVHLPELNEAMLGAARSSGGHAMIPSEVVARTIPLVEPARFHADNRDLFGTAVLLPVGSHNVHGRASVLYASNEHVLETCKKFPSFFVPFASLDMTSRRAGDEIQRLHDQGFVGVKYHALEGYSIADPRCEDALCQMEELGMPVVVHTGDTPFPGTNLDYAHPREVLKIAQAFPELRIMITHFATPYHLEAFAIASRHTNVFMDVAEFPVYWKSHPDNIYGPLLSSLNTRRIGIDKFVFGTDFPMPTFQWVGNRLESVVHSPSAYLREFLDLPDAYLSPEEKKMVLCENFWNFLGKTKEEVVGSNKTARIPLLEINA